jgi:hypothetical protein
MYDCTGNHSYLQALSVVRPMIFLKFLQYEEFFAYVTTEPSRSHQDFRQAGHIPHCVPVADMLQTQNEREQKGGERTCSRDQSLTKKLLLLRNSRI